jgi:hypothetical protein
MFREVFEDGLKVVFGVEAGYYEDGVVCGVALLDLQVTPFGPWKMIWIV